MIHLQPIVCRHAIYETFRSINDWSEWKDPVSRFLVHLNENNVLNNWIIASLLGLIIVLIIASFGAISFDLVSLMMELDASIDMSCSSLRSRAVHISWHSIPTMIIRAIFQPIIMTVHKSKWMKQIREQSRANNRSLSGPCYWINSIMSLCLDTVGS